MPTPFPGMDPYLEHPGLWPDVHNRVLAALADELGEQLRPAYYARLEERTYVVEPEGLLLVGRPDLSVLGPTSPARRSPGVTTEVVAVEVPVPDRVRETWLEIRAAGSGEVVTALELLSPTNKRRGEGRTLYEHKRQLILGTLTNLVEIDLIRSGEPMPLRGTPPTAPYRILVSRGSTRPRAELLLFGPRDPIPQFTLPLRGEPTEPTVDLGHLLHRLYDRAAYDLSIDYRQPPVPAWAADDDGWADTILREAGLR